MAPDASDLTALLDRYERPLVRYALSITGELDAARDVVQETFIKYVESGRAESPRDASNGASAQSLTADRRPVEAWLFTVCRNGAIDHQRKQSRIVPMHPIDDRRCEEPGPVAILERREMAGLLLGLLNELSANQREVIRLKFQNDLSYREIAEITELSVTNVGFLLHTGLKKLRSLVLERGQDDFPLPARQSL